LSESVHGFGARLVKYRIVTRKLGVITIRKPIDCVRPPFTIQHEKYIIIYSVIIKIDGSTQKISPVIQIPRHPFHVKENARTDTNIENRKRKGLKFCNFAAILNNSDNAGVVSNPSNSFALKIRDKGRQR